MASWGHTIARMPEDVRWTKCQSRKCEEQAVFLCQYSYITGRRGRVSHANKWRCERHGGNFQKNNGAAEIAWEQTGVYEHQAFVRNALSAWR